MLELKKYLASWRVFRAKCDRKVKIAGCHINNKCWNKLKEFHLEEYLCKMDKPFKFLFRIKVEKPKLYNSTKGMSRLYHKYKNERKALFQDELSDKSIFERHLFYVTEKKDLQ